MLSMQYLVLLKKNYYIKAFVYSSFQIATSETRKYTIKILVKKILK